jgi:hypothetical protein
MLPQKRKVQWRKTAHDRSYSEHLEYCRYRPHRIVRSAYYNALCRDVRINKLHKLDVLKMRAKIGRSYCLTNISMAKRFR